MNEKLLKEAIIQANSRADILSIFKNLGFSVEQGEDSLLVVLSPNDLLEIVFYDNINDAIAIGKTLSYGKFCTLGISNTFEEWIFIKRVVEDGVKLKKFKFSKAKLKETPKPIAIQKLLSFKYNDLKAIEELFTRKDVTKKFYDEFKKLIDLLKSKITGIKEEKDKQWYASVLVNRILFLYFIQHKELLGNRDKFYLSKHLKNFSKKKKDTYFKQFLQPLFFQGLSQKDKSAESTALLETVPYLNGGLFQEHILEKENASIQVPDTVFEQIFQYLDTWNWHLDEKRDTEENEINPEVLGYIFEKLINQKQMGAYYTKEDITGYISKNTIIPRLLDRVKEQEQQYFMGKHSIFQALFENPDLFIYNSVKHGVVTALPPEIAVGINDVSKRTDWNKPADAMFGLPTETWREVVARRARYFEMKANLEKGLGADGKSVFETNDLITYNLNIIDFTLYTIRNTKDIQFVKLFYASLQKITILDPTCGSGAFLFSALNILEDLYEACLDRLEDEKNKLIVNKQDAYSTKLTVKYSIYKTIILNNLYGVDIMEEAVEICKLRLFLKLISQVEREDRLDNLGIEPLPDIDFNILSGNTLVGFAKLEDIEKAFSVGENIAFNFQTKELDQIKKYAGDIEVLHDEFIKRQLIIDNGQWIIDNEELRIKNGERIIDNGQLIMDNGEGGIENEELRMEKGKRGARSENRVMGASGSSVEQSSQTSVLPKSLHPDAQNITLKDLIKKKNGELNERLNQYLAKVYGVNIDKKKDYETWKETHKPFHWVTEFYSIIKNGGFDVIIGNPPYVEYSKVKGEYTIQGYETEECGNLYVYTIERCSKILNNVASIGMIVQLPIVCTDRMIPIQELLLKEFKHNYFSTFDDRPGKLFDGLEHIRATIFLSYKSNKNSFCKYTTNYIRWNSEYRKNLFNSIFYYKNKLSVTGSLLKISDKVHDGIFMKIKNDIILDTQLNGICEVYFHNAPQYWIRATDFIPYFWNEKDGMKKSVQIKIITARTLNEAKAITALLNSSLFYIWFISLSDCRHLNIREIENFPFDLHKINDQVNKKLSDLISKLMKSYNSNKNRKKTFYKTTGNVEYDEYYPKLSKPIIDEIDRVLAEHYGFTDEELDYIINYDIKYRMGKEEESEKG